MSGGTLKLTRVIQQIAYEIKLYLMIRRLERITRTLVMLKATDALCVAHQLNKIVNNSILEKD